MDHTLPQPERDAGSRAILQTMLQLVRMGFLVKFWPHDQIHDPRFGHLLEDAGIEVLVPANGTSFKQYLKNAANQFDFAILSRPDFAPRYVSALRRLTNARLIYFGHDLHFRRLHAQAQVTGDVALRAAAEAMLETERAIWSRVDGIIYPSGEEADLVAEHVDAAKVHAVPLYFFGQKELATAHSNPNPNKLVFVACFGHPPNEDAAEWLVHSILPLVRQRLPDVTLHLVGSLPTERVLALASPGVHVTGAVSAAELERHYASAAVVISPMRFGGGVKLKVVEAMARGVPVVTTSVGTQGLPGAELCVEVADDAEGLALAVSRLMTDPAYAQPRTEAARQYVREHYSEQCMQRALWGALVQSALVPRGEPSSVEAEHRSAMEMLPDIADSQGELVQKVHTLEDKLVSAISEHIHGMQREYARVMERQAILQKEIATVREQALNQQLAAQVELSNAREGALQQQLAMQADWQAEVAAVRADWQAEVAAVRQQALDQQMSAQVELSNAREGALQQQLAMQADWEAEVAAVRANWQADVAAVRQQALDQQMSAQVELSNAREGALQQQLAMQADWEAEVAAVRADWQAEVAAVRADWQAEVAAVRQQALDQQVSAQAELAKVRAEYENTITPLREQAVLLQQVLSSRSWKMTRPLRFVFRLLRGNRIARVQTL